MFDFFLIWHTVFILYAYITGTNDISIGSFNDNTSRIWNRVRHTEEAHLEIFGQGNKFIINPNNSYIKRGKMRKLCLAFLDKQSAKLSGINWRITKSSDDVGHAANVVKGAVRNHYGPNSVLALLKIFYIW